MLIDAVVREEADRNKKMISDYKSLLDSLPKGSLILRKNGYYYLKYRKDGRLFDKYVGKDQSVIDEIRKDLSLRKHYSDMLSALEKEQKIIQKLLEVIL